jgi:Na+-driven multidrug efflux pump
VVINRTLVYGSLTATLVALCFGGIVVLQRFFIILTGQQSTLAVVASTLLIAALFTPLRRRIQSFIDKRFYRRKYDLERP